MKYKIAGLCRFLFFVIGALAVSGCSWESTITDKSTGLSSLSACSPDQVLSGQCAAEAGQIVTSTMGSNVTSWSNAGSGTTVISSIPDGYYQSKQCSFEDLDLTPANIANGVNVFGVLGTASGSTFALNMASSAPRDPGVKVIPNLTDLTSTSAQLTLNSENSLYAGADLPTTGGYNYRDVPSMAVDDEGYYGTNCKYAPRPTVDCGTSQATLALRVADCQNLNGSCSDLVSTTKAACDVALATWTSTATWNGATQCNGGQGLWRLVVRSAANKEVWQDQRTGLLWSSIVNTGINWCRATGNTELTPLTFINSFNNTAGTPITGNGTIGSLSSGTTSVVETVTITFTSATAFTVSGAACGGGAITGGGLTVTAGSTVTWSRANYCSFTLTQGSTNFAVNDRFTLLSSLNSVTSCAPSGPLQPASPVSYCAEAAGLNAGVGDDWGTPVYMTAKGGLGKNSTPGVRWRSPSIYDYKLADVNGVRFVMPDMGIGGAGRPSPDGSVAGYNEWSSSVASVGRSSAWYFSAENGLVRNNDRANVYGARCVGR